MIYRTLDDIYDLIEAEQARFVTAVTGLSEEQTNSRPAHDEWTIAEIAEHLAITNNGFYRIVNRLLKQAEQSGAAPLTALNLSSILLQPDGTQNPNRFPAPEVVKPQGNQPLAESLAKLEQSLNDIQTLRARLAATDCSMPTFPHPAVGELNAYQWMIVQGEHLDRHRGQVERQI
jgi:DinB superfamily